MAKWSLVLAGDNLNGQRRTSLIHPKMAFRAQFGSIGGVGTG